MIAMSPNNQLLAMLIMGIGAGMIFTRTYDAVRHHLAMERIRRNVVAYAAVHAQLRCPAGIPGCGCGNIPPIPPTSGPEVTPDLAQTGQPAPPSVPSETPAAWGRSGVTPPARSTLQQLTDDLNLTDYGRQMAWGNYVHDWTPSCFDEGCKPHSPAWDDYGYPADLGYGGQR